MDVPSSAEPAAYGLRQRLGLALGPAAFAAMALTPVPDGLSAGAWWAAAVGMLMAVWWVTEALPIPITSLLPLVLFPPLGVLPVREAAAPYAHPLIFLFMGGFLLALGMERWGLHRRLALSVILVFGTRPRRIVAGFMASAAFLSMWISNTATAMMMLPIGLSVVALVEGERAEGPPGNFAIVLMLAIAYACSIGGLGTLIGTPPNALLAAFLDETYGFAISFAGWMAVGVPLAALGLVAAYVVLVRVVYPIHLAEIPGGRVHLREELRTMGRMQRAEVYVAVVFGLTALLWMTRPLLEAAVPGLSDTGIAVGGALVLFLLPVDWRAGTFVMNWTWARRLPWDVLLLFGGGLSLAAAVEATGLAAWIGAALGALEAWPVVALVLLVGTVIILLTELTSNTATAAAFLPVVAALAVGIGQNPLLLAVPAALAASCAFMLPVATPPNAIVYGSSFVTIPQMARAGLVLNVVFVLLITALVFALLPYAMDVELGVRPPWAG